MGYHLVNFREKEYILAIFCKNILKTDIISDVIIPITTSLKIFSIIFFVTLQSMTMPNFMIKAFSYQDLCRGDTMCPSPRALSDKNTPGQIGINVEYFSKNLYCQ